jgi:hypothetical protein
VNKKIAIMVIILLCVFSVFAENTTWSDFWNSWDEISKYRALLVTQSGVDYLLSLQRIAEKTDGVQENSYMHKFMISMDILNIDENNTVKAAVKYFDFYYSLPENDDNSLFLAYSSFLRNMGR